MAHFNQSIEPPMRDVLWTRQCAHHNEALFTLGDVMKEVDEKYYERADAHIRLSNDQITEKVGHGKVSASFMFGAARFNAHLTATSWNSQKEFSDGKDAAIKYFIDEYRTMLVEHMDDYEENFNAYMDIKE